jgi:hypothetical protein
MVHLFDWLSGLRLCWGTATASGTTLRKHVIVKRDSVIARLEITITMQNTPHLSGNCCSKNG